jgi:hypothetical protein
MLNPADNTDIPTASRLCNRPDPAVRAPQRAFGFAQTHASGHSAVRDRIATNWSAHGELTWRFPSANRERAQSGDLLRLTSDAAVWDSAARRPLPRTRGYVVG